MKKRCMALCRLIIKKTGRRHRSWEPSLRSELWCGVIKVESMSGRGYGTICWGPVRGVHIVWSGTDSRQVWLEIVRWRVVFCVWFEPGEVCRVKPCRGLRTLTWCCSLVYECLEVVKDFKQRMTWSKVIWKVSWWLRYGNLEEARLY